MPAKDDKVMRLGQIPCPSLPETHACDVTFLYCFYFFSFNACILKISQIFLYKILKLLHVKKKKETESPMPQETFQFL